MGAYRDKLLSTIEKAEFLFVSKKYVVSKIILFIAILVALPYLPEIADDSRTGIIINLIIYYLFLNILGSFFSKIMIAVYNRKNKYDKANTDNFTIGVERITSFLIIVIFLFIILRLIDVEIWTLLTSISIFGVAIVLTFRDYLSNFIHGMALMFSTDFKIGENIQVGEYEGKIIDISFINVKLKNELGETIFIPNSHFLTKGVLNYSKAPGKKTYFKFTLDYELYKYFDKLEETIKTKLKDSFPKICNDISTTILDISAQKAQIIVEIQLEKYTVKIDKEIKQELTKTILAFTGDKLSKIQRRNYIK